MWLFARFGGELATSGDLPIPDGSRLAANRYEAGYAYMTKLSLYFNDANAEELRQWYVDTGINMSPIPLDLEGATFIEYDDYYGTPSPFHIRSTLQSLHLSSVYLTSQWYDEMAPDCQAIQVYKNGETVSTFPAMSIPEGYTAIVITTCWPDLS